MNTVVNKDSIIEVVNGIESFRKGQLTLETQLISIQSKLNNLLQNNPLNAQSTDDLREIQCIVDAIRRVDISINVNLHSEIQTIVEKVDQVISKIKSFQEQYSYQQIIPAQIYSDIQAVIEICRSQLKSFESFQEILNFISKSGEPIKSISVSLEKDSNKDAFRIWAEAMEPLAEGIEELVNLCHSDQLVIFENVATQLLVITVRSSFITNKKEEYRRKIRYAATFILDVVKAKKLDVLNQKSAEDKAIERLENPGEISWVSVLEEGQDINIDKIHYRLKQRGYKIKLSCQD